MVTDVEVSDENVIFIGVLKSDRTLISYRLYIISYISSPLTVPLTGPTTIGVP